MPDEQLTLIVKRASNSHSLPSETHELNGDANFIWDQMGFLLCDPLLVSLSLERKPTYDAGTKVTEDR